MAGGSGLRFWPASTQGFPKQFLPVPTLDKSYIQTTAERFKDIVPPERTVVTTTRRLAPLVRQHLPWLPEANIIQEPYNRDTAPCIALTTYTILKRDPSAMMVVVPCDHIIRDHAKFRRVLERSFKALRKSSDVIGTIGLKPTRPDVNYGYIQTVGIPEIDHAAKVKTFVEKPDAELAKQFVDSGEFLWNSGIYIWAGECIKGEIETFMPEMAEQFKGWEVALGTPFEADFLDNAYSNITKMSIDYGVMEFTAKAWVYPTDMDWYDVGTWNSLYNYILTNNKKELDAATLNAANCPHIAINTKNTLLMSTDSKKLIAVDGLDGYVVINTPDVLLVCPRDDKRLRECVSELYQSELEKYR